MTGKKIEEQKQQEKSKNEWRDEVLIWGGRESEEWEWVRKK